MKLGFPLPAREDLFKSLKEQKSDKTYPIKFQGKNDYRAAYRISIEVPKYRLANGRTSAYQDQWIVRHNLAEDFFGLDAVENEATQKAQHEILKTMLKEHNLLKFFETHTFDYPIVLDSKGFVINGNRRLCALRELVSKDEKKFDRFKHVDAIILPPCTEKDIDELEYSIQLEEDIKAKYSWSNFAHTLRQKRVTYGDEELSRIYHLKPKAIQNFIEMLHLAEDYLQNRGFPKEYDQIDTDELGFAKLMEGRASFEAESEKDLFKHAAYCLIDKSDGGRTYQTIQDVKRLLPKIKSRLVSEIPSPEKKSAKVSPLGLLGGLKKEDAALLKVTKFLQEEKNREVARDVILEVIDEDKTIEKERKTANFTMSQITKAHGALAEACNGLTKTTVTTGIDEQLQAIEDYVSQIRLWLKNKR